MKRAADGNDEMNDADAKRTDGNFGKPKVIESHAGSMIQYKPILSGLLFRKNVVSSACPLTRST